MQNALAKASESVQNMRWLEVTDTRGHIEDGRVAHWQVTVKVGFTLGNSLPAFRRRLVYTGRRLYCSAHRKPERAGAYNGTDA